MTNNLLTIRDIAGILDVPWRRVAVWFDSQRLKGTRVGNGPKRRVSPEHFAEFMTKYGTEFGLAIKGQPTEVAR
jgi:hypothetical protein